MTNSANSFAYLLLDSAFGPSERNCAGLSIRNGFTSASQFARAYGSAFGEPPSRTRLAG